MIKKIVLAGALTTASLFATPVNNSLIAIEGGYNAMQVDSNNGSYSAKPKLGSVGLKIGAEGDSYRVFLSARYLNGSDFDTANSFGAEAQYLLHFNNTVNLFLGGSYGYISLKMKDATNFTREVSTTYFGGDIGLNFNLSQSFDLELGARVININEKHLKNGVTYTFDNMMGGYGSIIYRFHLN